MTEARNAAAWVWCEDSTGRPYWEPVPADLRAAIAAAKVRRIEPRKAQGYQDRVEIEDSEVTPYAELDVSSL